MEPKFNISSVVDVIKNTYFDKVICQNKTQLYFTLNKKLCKENKNYTSYVYRNDLN